MCLEMPILIAVPRLLCHESLQVSGEEILAMSSEGEIYTYRNGEKLEFVKLTESDNHETRK